MPYLTLTSILTFCVAVGRLWSRQWVNAITAFSGVWLASLVVLGFTSESSLEYITWKATALIAIVHLVFTFSFCVFYLPNQHHRRWAAAAGEPVCSNNSITLWLYWLCAASAVIGVGVMIHTVYGGQTLSFAAALIARDELTRGVLVLPLGGRIASNFAYPAAVLGPVIGLRSQTWKGYLFMVVPLVLLLGLSMVTGGRGPLLIGVFLMGWAVVAEKTTRSARKRAKRTLAVLACSTFVYCILIAESRGIDKSGLQSIAEYVRGPVPAFSAWLESSPSLPMINFNLIYLAPVREIVVRSGGEQPRNVDSTIVYVPSGFNVFTCLAEHCESFGWVGMVFVWSAIGAGVALLESSGPSPFRAAILSVAYTYLSYSLICDLAFFVTGWLLAAALITWLALLYRSRLQRVRSHVVNGPENCRRGV